MIKIQQTNFATPSFKSLRSDAKDTLRWYFLPVTSPAREFKRLLNSPTPPPPQGSLKDKLILSFKILLRPVMVIFRDAGEMLEKQG